MFESDRIDNKVSRFDTYSRLEAFEESRWEEEGGMGRMGRGGH